MQNDNNNRKQLRKTLRARRRSLSRFQQKNAAMQLLKKLRSHPVFIRSQRIAFYMADDGELDPGLLMESAIKMGKQCYLPILDPLKRGKLLFGVYHPGDLLYQNYFGLSEPTLEKVKAPAWSLDLVIMPLVGFDKKGNRLGMGGGFYDRTFAFKQGLKTNDTKVKPEKPVLLGIAHGCQQVDNLNAEVWDIPLNYIVTDQHFIEC